MRVWHHHRIDLVVSGLAMLLAVAPIAAHAQLVTRFAVYVHSGPGYQYAVTDELNNGTPLAPESCKAGWCLVRTSGVPGYVPQNMLINGPATAQPKPGDRPLECMDFARTGWPNSGDLERVCIFAPNQQIELSKP